MRVMLGVPTTRGFPVEYVKSLWGTRIKAETHWFAASGLAIDVARNLIVEKFLESRCDYLIMHDSDATWHPDAPARLIACDVPMITAVVYQRRFPTVPFAGIFKEERDGETVYSFEHAAGRVIDVAVKNGYQPSDNPIPPLFDEDVIEEIDACGSHFVCIRRDVLERVEPPYYSITHRPSAGEDFYFCRKVKAAGFPIYVNYAVHTGHVAGDGLVIGLREFMLYSYGARQHA